MLYQAQMRNFIRLVLIALLGSSLASCSTWVSDDFADPQVQHLGMAKEVTAKDGHTFLIVGQPVALSRTPSRVVRIRVGRSAIDAADVS